MLNSFSRSRPLGFTLIELLISIVILGILTSISLPGFKTWITNSKIRNAAESITNGLQKARAEAVTRNTNVAFTLGAGNDSSWSVYVVNPASTVDSRSANEGSQDVTRSVAPAGATTITFNGFGSVLLSNPGSGVPVAPVTEVDLAANGGTQLNVKIGVGGNARMCDPSLSTGPRSCTY